MTGNKPKTAGDPVVCSFQINVNFGLRKTALARRRLGQGGFSWGQSQKRRSLKVAGGGLKIAKYPSSTRVRPNRVF